MKKNVTIFMFALLLSISMKLQAQVREYTEETQHRNGYVSFAKIKKEKSATAKTEAGAIIRELTGSTGGISYVIKTLDVPSKRNLKIQQEKYQLYKNGIKLRGGEYIINFVNDTVRFIHGFFALVSDEAFANNAQTGAELALKHFNTSHGISDTANGSAGVADTLTQVYYYDNATEKFRAAWQVQVTSKNGAYSENVFISATTGEFLGTENLICSINFPGTAQTQYNGTRNIVTDAPTAAGPFRLQETRNGVMIRTRNMNHLNDLTNVTDFTDNDNNWTTTEHGNDRAALDAHWGAEMVFDYWQNVHGRNSIDGNGMTVESYVHWDVPNDPDDFNASWSPSQNAMRYGDGLSGTNPLTSLDICAHEFGHGIDQYTGDLLYERESGALDEGFADIWGASVEAWVDPTKNRWLIGEEILSIPIRNMANPNAFGQPDTYLGTNWVNQTGCTPSNANDGCGVHTNSGVLNFWYFLLSQGGTGTNDIGNTYNVTGLGINTAEEIAYATKLLLNSSNANYPLARNISIQATTNLFGANSCEVKTVTDAWFAVGVGPAYNGTLGASLTGPSLVCTSEETFTLNNVPSGATVTWQATPANLFATSSGSGTIPALAAANSSTSGAGTLTFTITAGCGNSVQMQKAVWAGPPSLTNFNYTVSDVPQYPATGDVCANAIAQFSVQTHALYPSISNILWSSVGAQLSVNIGSNVVAVYNGQVGTYAVVSATATGQCGQWIGHYTVYQEVGDCGLGGVIMKVPYPNPATDVLIVPVEPGHIVELYNSEQERKYLAEATGNEVVILLQGIPNGAYTLVIKSKDKTERKRILVNR